MENKDIKIAVIGAGITGLTTAYYLNKNGFNVKIFEKSNHIGGVINSFTEDGFVYETGPNTGTISNIETVELFENLANDFELEIANDNAKKRLIFKNNKWYPLPTGPISGAVTPLFKIEDKLNILLEPFKKVGNNPFETVADLVKRRLGNSFLDYAVDPFISGIYAGKPDYLVTKFALPKLYNLEQQYGSFIGGSIKKMKEPKDESLKKISKKIFSAKGGLLSIIKALEKNIGTGNIYLNSNTQFHKKENYFVFEDQIFSHIVSTVNAKEIFNIFPFVDKQEIKNIENLKYAKVAEITLGFNNWQGIDLKAFGGLIPSIEQKNILGVLFMSTLFKNRAPKNGALLTSFIGGIKNESLVEMPEEELRVLLEKDFIELLEFKEFKPDLFKIHYHNRAIAQYGVDSENRLKSIENIEKMNKGLFLAGSIRDGIGIADRIKQGTNIAYKIINS